MFRNYEEVVQYMYSSVTSFQTHGKDAYKPGLETMYSLLQGLNNPQDGKLFVHVGGTNGKGSVTSLIASVLSTGGYRVGLYTSPHLVDFRERIKVLEKVDGRVHCSLISKDAVVEFINSNYERITKLRPSFFEITTAMALCHFHCKNVDVAVMEVGLGGRLDSTNIIEPQICIITNVGLDHTDLLGDTLSAIASEKAGIMKASVPCVIGEYDSITAPVFIAKAKSYGVTELYFANNTERKGDKLICRDMLSERIIDIDVLHAKSEFVKDVSVKPLANSFPSIASNTDDCDKDNLLQEKMVAHLDNTAYSNSVQVQSYSNDNSLNLKSIPSTNDTNLEAVILSCGLDGDYQRKNARTAYMALKILGMKGKFKIRSEDVLEGFARVVENTGLRGRWERLSDKPLIICDIGHNGHAWKYLVGQIKRAYTLHICRNTGAHLRIIFGMVRDKDVREVVSMLPLNAVYYFTQASTLRAVSAADLKQIFTSSHPSYMGEHQSNMSVQVFDSVSEAVQVVMSEAELDDFIFIGGSNYVVGECIQALQKTNYTS